MLVNLQQLFSYPVLRTPFLELLVTLVTKHEYQKACSLMVPEQKLLPIHDHSLLHCVICVSGEAHTQDSCPSNHQLKQLVRTALMSSARLHYLEPSQWL